MLPHYGFALPMPRSAHPAAAARHTDSRTDTSAGLWLSGRARFEAPELYLELLSGLPRPSPRPSPRLRALSKCPPSAPCTVYTSADPCSYAALRPLRPPPRP